MEGLVLIVVAGVVIALSALAGKKSRYEHFYTTAAQRLGFGYLDKGPGMFATSVSVMKGTRDGFSVLVKPFTSNNWPSAKIIVGAGRRAVRSPPPKVTLLNATGLESIRRLRGREGRTGDPNFDRAVFVGGRPEEGAALLDSGTRAAVKAAFESMNGLSVEEGKVTSVFSTYGEQSLVEGLVMMVEKTVTFAARLDFTREQIPLRLAENAVKDPWSGVRLRCLDILAREYVSHPARKEALEAALGDSDPEVRFLAARETGEKGFDTMAALLKDTRTPEDLAARVFAVMRDRYGPERVIPLARGKVFIPDGPLLPSLLKAMKDAPDPAYEQEIIEALVAESEQVRLAAAEALWDIGTVAAVAPLRAAVEKRPLDRRLRRAAEIAVTRIRERLDGAEAGQVSLSEMDDPAGQVSLDPEREGGELSLEGVDEGAVH